MDFGLLSLSDLQTGLDTGERVSAGQRIADTIGYAVLGERLGLDVFALGEHPGGRGFVVNRAAFDAGTRRGQAIMVGSGEHLIEKILDASGCSASTASSPNSTGVTSHGAWWKSPCTATPPRSRPPSGPS
jgi:hypothetical protein